MAFDHEQVGMVTSMTLNRHALVLVLAAVGLVTAGCGETEGAAVAPAASPAAAKTYLQPLSIERSAVRRASRLLRVTVSDDSCSADETHDSPERFAGVQVRKTKNAWVLSARFREQAPSAGASECSARIPNEDFVKTTVRLPAPVGNRAIVDSAPGPGGFRFVRLPPVGRAAIRSLVPAYIYTGDDCDASKIRSAFRGMEKTDWCFF